MDKIQPLIQKTKKIEEELNKRIILKVEEQSKIIGSVRSYEKNNKYVMDKIFNLIYHLYRSSIMYKC